MTKLRPHVAVLVPLLLAAFATDAGATVSYVYDDLGRVSLVTYDNGTQVSYTYDAAGNRTQHTVNAPINHPPTAVNDTAAVTTASGGSGVILAVANDSDVDGDLLTVQSVTTPLYGTATVSGGGATINYLYTASIALPATDTFTYVVTDGRGGTATATVTVQLSVGNNSPTANPDSAYGLDETVLQLDPRLNDTDPENNPLTVIGVTNGAHGSVFILNGGTLVEYDRTSLFPGPGGIVTDTFTYTISDGLGGTATSTVDVVLEASGSNCGGPGQPICP